MNIPKLLAKPDRNFQHRGCSANDAAFQQFVSSCSFNLPTDYLQLIRSVNGAEGELAIEPGWFQLWPIEDVLNLNEGYEVGQFHPGYFGFGSSGGGVMFAFNAHASEPSTVFGIPFDSIDPANISVVAKDLMTFIEAMGYPCPDDA